MAHGADGSMEHAGTVGAHAQGHGDAGGHGDGGGHRLTVPLDTPMEYAELHSEE